MLRHARRANKQRRNQPADDFPERSASMPLPAEPTDVFPGEDRVDVLAARVLAGEQLWHPLDENGDERRRALRAVIKAQKRMNGTAENLGYVADAVPQAPITDGRAA